jgi:regulatory protein
MNKDLALQKCMKLCSVKEYAPGEITEKLSQWGVIDDEIPAIINTLIEEKFLDERRMARYYVNDKIRFNKWGKIKIGIMLKHKGVSNDAINEAMDQFDDNEYQQILENELKKKRKSIKENDSYIVRGKLAQFASGRGFESDVIHRVIDNLIKD